MKKKSFLVRTLIHWITPQLRFITHNTELWQYVEAHGYHVTPVHFYQPIPDTHELMQKFPERSETIGIDWNEGEQLKFLHDVFPRYASEYNTFDAEYNANNRPVALYQAKRK